MTSLNLCKLDQDIIMHTHRYSRVIDWVVVHPDNDIHDKYAVADSLDWGHYCIKSCFSFSVSNNSTTHRTPMDIANIEHPSFIAELSNYSSVEDANNFFTYYMLCWISMHHLFAERSHLLSIVWVAKRWVLKQREKDVWQREMEEY